MLGDQPTLPGVKEGSKDPQTRRVAAVEKEFDLVKEREEDQTDANQALKDQRQRLFEVMKDNKIETYQKHWRGKPYVAAITTEETVNIKKQTKDRVS